MTTKLKKAIKTFFGDQTKFEAPYYLKDTRDNTFSEIPPKFRAMFDNGNGGEFVRKGDDLAKAAAVHSSSMLAYNFFGWIDQGNPFTFEGVEYDKVVFEEQLRVLAYGTSDNVKFPVSNAKANMDVVLAGENLITGKTSLLFIESKFTEHLSNAHADMTNMVLSYSVPRCYFTKGEEWAALIKSWKDRASDEKKSGYYSGIKQDICHLISISNFISVR